MSSVETHTEPELWLAVPASLWRRCLPAAAQSCTAYRPAGSSAVRLVNADFVDAGIGFGTQHRRPPRQQDRAARMFARNTHFSPGFSHHGFATRDAAASACVPGRRNAVKPRVAARRLFSLVRFTATLRSNGGKDAAVATAANRARWRARVSGVFLAFAAGPAAAQAPSASPEPTALPVVESVSVAPLPSSGIARDRVAGNPRSFNAADVLRSARNGTALTDTLERLSGSVIRNDAQGNPFAPDVQIRGFSASPLLGTPQGLAVYQNGVRINEAFGDTVNWDLIPEIAIRDIEVIGSNPLFGLNALGGALALRMRSGFDYQGAEIDASGGSFGRRSLAAQAGRTIGNVAAYIAAEGVDDDGWRRNSPSRIRRLYGDLGFRGERATLNLSLSHGSNTLTGNGPTPVELLQRDRRALFTYPDRTRNRLLTLQARGTYELTSTVSLESTAYVRSFRQRTFNADIAEIESCETEELAGLLCLESGSPIAGANGAGVGGDVLGGAPAGALNRTGTDSLGAGGSLQLVSRDAVFRLPTKLVVGVSYDHGNTEFNGSSELGAVTAARTVNGTGNFLDQPADGIAAVRLRSTNAYYGAYGSATIDLTNRVSASIGGRFNIAEIDTRDRLGTSLNGRSEYSRFNPAAGLTWRFTEGATAYAGYSEANRAPTAAELSCADPLIPCTLGAFFLSDPPLKQVISRTVELGVRGSFPTERYGLDGRARWNVGFFTTGLTDDILLVQSDIQGRGFFRNAGDTRRAGIEAGLAWRNDTLAVGLDYALIDATFQTAQRLPSPNNPFADADGAIPVERGDRIPGIPRHRLRFDAEWRPVPAWTLGGAVIFNASQYLRGDEANLLKPLADYATVNLRTSLRIGPGVEAYGLVRNLFDHRYATFGTLYSTSAAEPLGLGLSDPRTVSPGLPRAVFGGLRVTF